MRVRSDVSAIQTLVRDLAKVRGMPLTRLAYESQVCYTTLRGFVKGRTTLRIDLLDRILKTLGYNIAEMIATEEAHKMVLQMHEKTIHNGTEH